MTIKKIGLMVTLLLSLSFPAQAHAGLWDKFKNWATETVETIVDVAVDIVEDVVEVVVETVEEVVTNVVEFIVDTGAWLYDTLTTVIEGSLNFFFGVANGTVTVLSFFGLDVDISHWFTSGIYNSEDHARVWKIEDYDHAPDRSEYKFAFQERQNAYIDSLNLSEDDAEKNDHRIIRTYLGLSLDESGLQSTLDNLAESKNPDFTMIELMRIIAQTDAYDEQIVTALIALPFWQDEDTERKRVYTSENHALMWMSATWLLWEMESLELGGGPDKVRERLVRYLNVKTKYGFYESLSGVYNKFTMVALLNLYDFAQDIEIKTLAGQAALLLLNDIAMVTNDLGAPIAVDARAYERMYMQSDYTTGDYSSIARMVTGLGHQEYSNSNKLDALATTTLDVSGVIYNRLEKLGSQVNLSYQFGHSINAVDSLWQGLDQQDKVIFSQSAGAYAHPELIDDLLDVYLNPLAGLTFFMDDLIVDANLADDIVDMSGVLLNETSAPFTTSSIISEKTMDLYRHGNVQLASLQNYHAGNAGWQQQPWSATAGEHAVYTRTGAEFGGWKAGGQEQMNTHLPYIRQNGNVALILYKAAMELRFMDSLESAASFIPVDDFETEPVNLYWPEAYFDDTATYGNWIFGREGDGYVAIYRHCQDTKTFSKNEKIEGVEKTIQYEEYSCRANEQVWAAVVGNEETHESFTQFIFTVSEAKIKSKWYWSWAKTRHVWETTIEVDGKTISYGWEANVDDLTDAEMWELAGVTRSNTIESAAVQSHQTDNITHVASNSGVSHCARHDNVILHQTTTYNGADSAILRLQEGSDGQCAAFLQEDQSLDDETEHTEETIHIVSFENTVFAGGEAGILENINDEWFTVELNFSYTHPVIFASIVTANGMDPVVTELRNVTSSSFDVRLAEFNWNDGTHTYENVHYVVMEAGTYPISNNRFIEVGAVLLTDDLNGSTHFETVGVDLQNYQLITQVQGHDAEWALSTRLDNVTTGHFDVSLMVEDANKNKDTPIQGLVGYMAVGQRPVKSIGLYLQGDHGTYFYASENGGENRTVNASAAKMSAWGKIVLSGDSREQGCFIDGDTVWLQTTSGYYYSAQPNGELTADRTRLGSWEKFRLINHTDQQGCLQNLDSISLQSHFNHFVVAESDGAANANRSAIGAWERITVITQDNSLQQMPNCGVLVEGEKLLKDELLYSCNGQYAIKVEADRGIALYHADDQQLLWQSGSATNNSAYLALLENGELVTYDQSGQPEWRSDTHHSRDLEDYLYLNNAGHLSLYQNGTQIWTANTQH